MPRKILRLNETGWNRRKVIDREAKELWSDHKMWDASAVPVVNYGKEAESNAINNATWNRKNILAKRKTRIEEPPSPWRESSKSQQQRHVRNLLAARKLSKTIKSLKSPNKDMAVYHGWKPTITHPGQVEGGILRTRGFLSTSMNPEVATSFATTIDKADERRRKHILRIKVPKGHSRAKYISHLTDFQSEHEILIDRNSKIKIHPKPKVFHHRKDGIEYHVWSATLLESLKNILGLNETSWKRRDVINQEAQSLKSKHNRYDPEISHISAYGDGSVSRTVNKATWDRKKSSSSTKLTSKIIGDNEPRKNHVVNLLIARDISKQLKSIPSIHKDITVYHGWKPTDYHPGQVEGGILKTRGFLSTSMKADIAKNFAYGQFNVTDGSSGHKHYLRIKVPKNHPKAKYIAHLTGYENESEVLIDRNSKLKIHPKPKIFNKDGFKHHIWKADLLESLRTILYGR